MSAKVVPSYVAYGNSHPTLYEGNHWDHYFSLLPFLCHSPSLQYLMNALGRILYRALKLSIPSLESTK